ncbi:hypothetical protein [Solirubrobacter soli]|uniref:hypothetical protein n=1 Tax=Solirubrobacter soli TaxID=363832 RepID=UPI000480DC90|nr:hypothetical protein [Solirubrobacter soli]
MFDDSRSLPRRRVYLGEGLRFELDGRLAAEAVDMSADGLGLALVEPAPDLPAVGDGVIVRHTASEAQRAAVVRHVGRVRGLPLLGLALVPDT